MSSSIRSATAQARLLRRKYSSIYANEGGKIQAQMKGFGPPNGYKFPQRRNLQGWLLPASRLWGNFVQCSPLTEYRTVASFFTYPRPSSVLQPPSLSPL
jgi:hypothetical protein